MTQPLPRDSQRAHLVSDTLRRRWLSIVLLVIVVGGGVGGYLFTRSKTYSSVTTVVLRPLEANALSNFTVTSSQSTTVAMQTEASLVGSQPVTDRVNVALHLSLSPNSASIKVEVPVNSQIIKITYSSKSATSARSIARSYARSYLAYRTQLAETARDNQVRRLQTQRASAEKDLQTAITALHRKNPPVDAQAQVDLDKANISSILDQIAQTNSISTDAGSVILPATKAYPPGKLKPAAITAGALVAAAIVGFVLALWRERRDDRLRAAVESEPQLTRVLATVPDADMSAASAASSEADSATVRAEMLRQARAMLLALVPAPSALAVSGVTADEDNVVLTSDLARVFAAAGYTVAHVDAVIGEPSPEPGLSNLLADGLSDQLPITTRAGVARITAGTDPVGARERYSGVVLHDLFRRLRSDFDFVLVSAPPIGSGDGQAVALATDAVVLVATELRATHSQVQTAEEIARRLGVSVVGVLLRRGAVPKPAPSGRRRKRAAKRAGRTVDTSDAEPATDDESAPHADGADAKHVSAKRAAGDDTDVAASAAPAGAADNRANSVSQPTRGRNARRAGRRRREELDEEHDEAVVESKRVTARRFSGGDAGSDD